MSTNPPKAAKRPKIGDMRTYHVGGRPRPFLVVDPDSQAPQVGGWCFPVPRVDDTTAELKIGVANPALRQQPCYLVVPATDLS